MLSLVARILRVEPHVDGEPSVCTLALLKRRQAAAVLQPVTPLLLQRTFEHQDSVVQVNAVHPEGVTVIELPSQ